MPTLAEFAAALAEHMAQDRDWTLDQAACWLMQHIDEARREYREHGALLGNANGGFLAWLQPRRQPPTA